jgi:YVTN family beta-propeller protein
VGRFFVFAAAPLLCEIVGTAASTNSFVNFETAPVHPLALSPDGAFLVVCNLPDARLEVFEVSAGRPISKGSVTVGLDPVSVRFRGDREAWVVNEISDSVSVVDLETLRVVATLDTLDAPADVAFAGNPERAFVSCSGPNEVQMFDPVARAPIGSVRLEGQRPKAMAVSPDRTKLYVAIFESGNGSTILSAGVGPLTSFPQPTVVDFPDGPHAGLNPPPNSGAGFVPAINPRLPTNSAPPRVGLIVKRDETGRWLDDNAGDWTEYVNGTNSVFSGRSRGWDLLDHDVAVVDTAALSVGYITRLMNICMDVAVNPATGRLAVVGTEALNQVRYEPVLKGKFTRVQLALIDPQSGGKMVKDLNAHLDYTTPTLPESERVKSVGDPRGIVWSSDGTRAYVTGMGSGNLLILDAEGKRVGRQPALPLGEGPTGLALDEARGRLYVLNRFSATISIVDTAQETVLTNVPLFDPTPEAVKAGRKHLYDTHRTSGLGQASCGSCHVDARFDRLAWDLGDPTGAIKLLTPTNNNFGRFPPAVTNHFHPMKGPMVTQTLQDIIGHEPFHWRGDRDGLEQFNATFTNLQAAASPLTTNEMRELKDFLATISFPPNPYRAFNNSLSTNVPLSGHLALGRGKLEAGQPLPRGDAQAGLTRFRLTGNDGCTHCHTLPAGVGADFTWTGVNWRPFPIGADGQHHAAFIALERSSQLPFKISQLRNLYDKIGMDLQNRSSQTGFGFFHDGSVDSLTRFVQDSFEIRDDQETANLLAFLLSFTGSDLPPGSLTDPDRPPGLPARDAPAAVGRQVTLTTPGSSQLVSNMINLATSSTGRVDLVVHGVKNGLNRGWVWDPPSRRFQSDRNGEWISPAELASLAGGGAPLTYTVVPRGSGLRLGVDRDEDGYLDRTEVEFGSDPADPLSLATNRPPILGAVADQAVAAGTLLSLTLRATDPDVPAQMLTFSLDPVVPPGAQIDSSNGLFIWRPTQDQALQSYRITVRATDDGSPNRSATTQFTISVGQHPFAPALGAVSTTTNGVALEWQGIVGGTYRVQFKNSLSDPAWTDLDGDVIGGPGALLKVDASGPASRERYYRVLLLE